MHVIFISDRCNIYDNYQEKGYRKRDKIIGCVEGDIGYISKRKKVKISKNILIPIIVTFI